VHKFRQRQGNDLMKNDSKCPVTGKTHEHAAGGGTSNRDWWPADYRTQTIAGGNSQSNRSCS
jgi:catalase-peroxidase